MIARDGGTPVHGAKKPKPKAKSGGKKTTKKTTKKTAAKKPAGYKYANRLASAAINSTVRDLGNKSNAINRAYSDSAGDANTNYQRSVGDLKYLYDKSGKYIGDANSKIDAGFKDARAQSTAAGAALQQQIAANGQKTTDDVNSALNGLGINYEGATSGMTADQQYQSNQAAQNTQNNDANLGLMQGNAMSVGNLLLGMNSGSRTSNLGQALNARNDALSEAARTRDNQLAAINDSVNSAKAGRGDLIVQIMDQMRQSGWFKKDAAVTSSSSGGSGGGHSSGGGRGHSYSSGSGGSHSSSAGSVLSSVMSPVKTKKPKKKVRRRKVTIIPHNKFDQDGHPGIDY